MKKKIIYAAILILLAIGFTACEKTCQYCKKVYYVGSTYDHEDGESQYCGLELITIQGTGPVTIGGYTVKWECR
jgi:hypothetical protein